MTIQVRPHLSWTLVQQHIHRQPEMCQIYYHYHMHLCRRKSNQPNGLYSLMRFTVRFYLWFVIASTWTSTLCYSYWASLNEPHTNRTALCMVCVYACLLTTNFKWAYFNIWMSTCTLAQSRTRDYCAVSTWKRPQEWRWLKLRLSQLQTMTDKADCLQAAQVGAMHKWCS